LKYRGLVFICIVFVSFVAESTRAQSLFLGRSENEYVVGGLFSRDEGYSGFGGNAEYGITDVFGAGLNLARATNSDNRVISVSSYLSAIALQPDDSWPVGIAFSAMYSHTDQSRLISDSMVSDRWGNFYSFGVRLFLRWEISPNLIVYPTVGDTYVKGGVMTDDPVWGHFRISDISDLAETWGFSMQLFRQLVFDALATTVEGETSFTISLGLMIN
jgi:hypothetical protein